MKNPPTIDPKKLYTTKESADLIWTPEGKGISHQRARDMYYQKKFPNAQKAGHDILIPGYDLIAENQRRRHNPRVK